MSRVQRDMPHQPRPSAQPSVPIGSRVLQLLDVAYRARRPVMLEGQTGIGKSQIVEQFAQRARIDYRVLDLSLLEPPDLIGLPQFIDGRTHYAFPAELPTEGHGVLMLEELNRAEIPVMQPALQLLSARRLHSYRLPDGWSCVAAINPEQEDYAVNTLDKALRTRFLQLHVHADVGEWLLWAEHANVHPLVVRFVREHDDVFASSEPRSWAYAADVLAHLTPDELQQRDLVLTLLRGYLSTAWATALTETLGAVRDLPRLDGERCFTEGGVDYLRDLIAPLLRDGRTDAVSMLAFSLRAATPPPDAPADRPRALASLFPGDLREQLLRSLRDAEDR